MMKIVLASASPRRAEILRNAGIPFEVLAARVDETRRAGELRGDYVRRLALEKARAAAADANSGDGDCLFVGADTVVVAGDEILGKPRSEEDARRMLRMLRGSVHEVYTGLSVVQRPRAAEGVVDEVTRVTFAPLSDEEIERYIATGEPFDKAGATGYKESEDVRYANRGMLLQRDGLAAGTTVGAAAGVRLEGDCVPVTQAVKISATP